MREKHHICKKNQLRDENMYRYKQLSQLAHLSTLSYQLEEEQKQESSMADDVLNIMLMYTNFEQCLNMNTTVFIS